jgi:hypothetical protein
MTFNLTGPPEVNASASAAQLKRLQSRVIGKLAVTVW